MSTYQGPADLIPGTGTGTGTALAATVDLGTEIVHADLIPEADGTFRNATVRQWTGQVTLKRPLPSYALGCAWWSLRLPDGREGRCRINWITEQTVADPHPVHRGDLAGDGPPPFGDQALDHAERAMTTAKGAEGRDAYTWADATSDLALSTPLTLGTAAGVIHELESLGLHPYDTLPRLVEIYGDGYNPHDRARAVAKLIRARP